MEFIGSHLSFRWGALFQLMFDQDSNNVSPVLRRVLLQEGTEFSGTINTEIDTDSSYDEEVRTINKELLGVCLESSTYFNETECRRVDRRIRTFSCTDISPGERFTCEEQAEFGKCGRTWIWSNAYCLRSCDRCGASCFDIPPPGSAYCDASQCDSPLYTSTVQDIVNLKVGSVSLDMIAMLEESLQNNASNAAGPFCLATCRRCSVTSIS